MQIESYFNPACFRFIHYFFIERISFIILILTEGEHLDSFNLMQSHKTSLRHLDIT